MKKILLINLFLMSGACAFAQLPVSETVEMRKVVFEEFTGIYGGFCPLGHIISHSIENPNPDNVVVIKVHAGDNAIP